MIQVQQAHMCPKNCVIYVGEHSQDEACPKCNCPRYKPLDSLGRRAAAKYFSYCSLKDSLDLLFKCSNIAQIIQEAGGCSRLLLSDIQDTDTFNDIAKEEGVQVMLGLNTDGVNPFHGQNKQHSFWPLIFTIFNLPKNLRTKADAFLLYGIVPSQLDRQGHGVAPDLTAYQQHMIDELIQLCSVEIYSEYSQAHVIVKVKLLR